MRQESSTTMIHTRIDKQVKDDAQKVLDTLGISFAEASRMFFKQVALKQGIPFKVDTSTHQCIEDEDFVCTLDHTPNKETLEAIEDLKLGRNIKSYTKKEFHELLNAL